STAGSAPTTAATISPTSRPIASSTSKSSPANRGPARIGGGASFLWDWAPAEDRGKISVGSRVWCVEFPTTTQEEPRDGRDRAFPQALPPRRRRPAGRRGAPASPRR